MQIHVKLSTTLRKYVPDYAPEKGLELDIEKSSSPADIATQLGLPFDEIKFIMLNGRATPMTSALQDGDRLAFFPPVGGG